MPQAIKMIGIMAFSAIISVLSLLIAALAVFFGPMIQARSTRRQMESSLAIANKQITAPMRQTWINNLRDSIAQLASKAEFRSRLEKQSRQQSDLQELEILRHKILLMLNTAEADHVELEKEIKQMLEFVEQCPEFDGIYKMHYDKVIQLSRTIFKREWNRVKEPIHLDSGGTT